MQKRPAYKGIIPKGKKYCPLCTDILDLDLFKTKNGYIRGYCRECTATYSRERETVSSRRNANLKRNYHGFTLEQYEAMFLAQGGVRAACGQPETLINKKTNAIQNLHTDHDHKTGKVRALLCSECNCALGYLHDDPERIHLLLEYAKQWTNH